jgi:hypothetical protein
MKIDFKQLAKLEKYYSENGNELALNTIKTMLKQVLCKNSCIDFLGLEHSTNTIAINTLIDLKILKEDKDKKEPELLKS